MLSTTKSLNCDVSSYHFKFFFSSQLACIILANLRITCDQNITFLCLLFISFSFLRYLPNLQFHIAAKSQSLPITTVKTLNGHFLLYAEVHITNFIFCLTSIRSNNLSLLFIGNRLTPKAKTINVQAEYVGSALKWYILVVFRVAKDSDMPALLKLDARDIEIAALNPTPY